MNVLKVQQDYLAHIMTDTHHRFRIVEGDDDRIGLMTPYAVYFIPKGMLYLDITKAGSRSGLLPITAGFDKCAPGMRTGLCREVKERGCKRKMERVESKKGYAWLDVKLTKYFDDTATFHVYDKKHAVYVTEYVQIVAVIMPVKPKWEENENEES